MQSAIKIIDKSIESLLFLIIFIFPFSYSQLSENQTLILVIAILILSNVLIKKMTNILETQYWVVFLAVIFMFIFDFSEKVNFVQQFSIPIETSIRIPFTTILLSLAVIIYLIKILIEGKFMLPIQPFARYFIFSGVFIFTVLLIFYPIFKVNYQMSFEIGLHLMNIFIKYLFILILFTNYLNNQKKVKRLSIGLVGSIGVSVIISLILK